MATESTPPGGPFLMSADTYQKLMKRLAGGEVILDPRQFEKITRFDKTYYRLLPGAFTNENSPGGHQIALKIHSRTQEGTTYVGVGPYGNLWDAKVASDLTVAAITGRLADPGDPDDSGWMAISSGENLYLLCTITNGDIVSASLETGSSSPLVEFSDYTQTSFRVILARGETVDGATVVVPMHEGELVANGEIINGKWAKYAR
jgi:hypothetical protein